MKANTIHNFAKQLVMVLAVGLMAVNAWGTTYTGTFTKITSTDDLTTGYYVICASEDASANSSDRSGYAMSDTQTSSSSNKQIRADAVSITSGTTITNPDNAIVYYITVTTVEDVTTCTFQSVSTSKYLYQTATGNNRRIGFRDAVGDDGKATLKLLGYQDSSPHGFKFTFDLGNAANDTLEFSCSYNNPNYSQFFANYKGNFNVQSNSSQTPLRLFKLEESCDKKVTVSNGGGSTNGTITSITTSPVATCSSTASDRRVSIVVTPSTGYVAPEALSVGSTTGTVNSSKYSRTDNGNGTFTFVYEYNQNDNGTISYNTACVGKQCTVTFDKNSGTSGDNNVTATYGSAMTAIDPPTREHYDFAGYYDSETDNDGTGNKYYNADGSSAATWNKNTTSNTTLYAKWTEHGLTNYRTVCSSTYNVTYEGNGNTDGSVPTDNTDYDSGDVVTVLGNSGSLVKTHYAFDGWNTKADGSGDPYAEDETFEITKNITLYAQWACDENITISAGTPTNGSFTLSSTGDVETCSDDVVITVTPSPNTGYNFSAITQTGLNSGVTINQSDKTVTYDQYSSGTTTINVTFVAKTTTVTLNKNGATSGTNQTVSATYGLAMPTTTTASVDLAAPSKNGYTLLGFWDTDATTGGKQYYDANMTSVTSWDKEDATVTLYARWEAKVDRFIDDMHETSGYTSAAPHEESGNYTVPGPLSNTTPGDDCITSHYIFVGWVVSTGQNSSGTLKDSGSRIYRPGETIYATNAIYYAVWAEE